MTLIQIIGANNVGKNSYLEKVIYGTYGSNRLHKEVKYSHDNVDFVISNRVGSYMADGYILIVDLDDLQGISYHKYYDLKSKIRNSGIPYLVLANKVDKIEDYQHKISSPNYLHDHHDLGAFLCENKLLSNFWTISVKNNLNISKSLRIFCFLLKEKQNSSAIRSKEMFSNFPILSY